MNESPVSQTQPVSRVSTISRRLASKVLSMIEKYESLSRSNTRNQTLPYQQQPNPASGSNFRRLGKLVLARARLFVESTAEQNKPARCVERTVPPKRRFLKFSSKKKKLRTRTTKDWSNGFDHDGTISTNSTITETETESSITVSTPPVARILPSSFFRQLTSSKEPSGTRKLKSHGQWRKQRTSSKIRNSHLDMSRKEPNFSEIKRKLMPPKVSVRDLKERFQEAERAYTHRELKLNELDGSSRVRLRRNMIPKEDKAASRQFLRKKLMSGCVDCSFTSFVEDKNSGYQDHDNDSFYEAFDKEGLELSGFESSHLSCRDDMNYLNTEYHCMTDGSLSNFGYFLLRLESEAETHDPGLETGSVNENDFFTAPVPSTELSFDPEMKKTYRKTPPPSGFFFHPENDKNDGGQSANEHTEVHQDAARPSRAVDIVSPKPMNAVQAAQLRSMVFRYT